MKAFSVVVAANSLGQVNLRMVVVRIAVEIAVPIEAVTHIVGDVATVRVVTVAGVGSCHCSCEIASGIRTVFLLNSDSLYQVGLICSILKRREAELLGYEEVDLLVSSGERLAVSTLSVPFSYSKLSP